MIDQAPRFRYRLGREREFGEPVLVLEVEETSSDGKTGWWRDATIQDLTVHGGALHRRADEARPDLATPWHRD